MKSKRFVGKVMLGVSIILCASLVTGHSATAAYRCKKYVKGTGDNTCPSGYEIATLEDAEHCSKEVCKTLAEWDIARLAGGGSFDGRGYRCQSRSEDKRDLGHTVCRALAQAKAPACYWMRDKSPWDWIKNGGFAKNKTTQAECQALDSCSPGGGKKSNGGCYKWATSIDEPGVAW